MTAPQSPSARITAAVSAWPMVTFGPGRRGELSFKVGRDEIGHLHGDTAAHFGFEKAVWAALKAEGRIEDHPVFPGRPGPAARRIATDTDVEDVIALMRINYEALAP